MKRIRLWVCKSCGKNWRRKKHDTHPPFAMCCGKPVVKGRTIPEQRRSRYISKQLRIKKFKEKYLTRPRTNIGTVLRPSRTTRAAFRIMLRARTRPAMVRKAQLFLDELYKDINLFHGPKDGENKYVKKIDMETGEITRFKGGLRKVPTIFLSPNIWDKGEYRRSLMKGTCLIMLRESMTIPELHKTFVHETMHWIDDVAGMQDWGGHNCYWNMRLQCLAKKLRFKDDVD